MLKRVVADLIVDKAMLQRSCEKMVRSAVRRGANGPGAIGSRSLARTNAGRWTSCRSKNGGAIIGTTDPIRSATLRRTNLHDKLKQPEKLCRTWTTKRAAPNGPFHSIPLGRFVGGEHKFMVQY